ncbi:MAG: 16S rRNA (guanine(966)-N(2))-methyltransferase RsmD [Candidatus Saccharimonadales bacterium]
MIVRIISGEFGGRKIDAPGRVTTHAMSERIRNALFNSLGDEVKGASVLDAFAGSGSIGIEALSRGAKEAMFIERDRMAASIIAKNLTMLKLEPRTKLIRTTVQNWAATASKQNFDLIFADPPFNDLQFSTVSELMGLLKPNGLMILSHPGKGEVPSRTGIVVVDNRSYGNAYLTFFRRDA